MKNIILITNEIHPYRIPIYNYFADQFSKYEYNLNVITNKVLNYGNNKILFNLKIVDFNFFKYTNFIIKNKPICVIIFLHLKDFRIWPLVLWLKTKKIPIIYWGHGINLQDPNNIFKNYFFKFIHNISDSLLLYSEREVEFINIANRGKVFIANNTLNFNAFNDIELTKEELKKKHKIKFKKIVLFVGRITARKRIEDIIKVFSNFGNKDYGLIIIGPGLDEVNKKNVYKCQNIIYLGPIYKGEILNEFFKLSDVFSIPGTNGLGLVQAMYWGLPVVTEDVKHSPEISYLKNGINGFIVSSENISELKNKILLLLENKRIYEIFSKNAKKTITDEASIEKMFQGFLNAVKYVENKYKPRGNIENY